MRWRIRLTTYKEQTDSYNGNFTVNPAVSSTQEGDDITIVVTTAGGTAEFDAESAGDA